MTISMPPRRIVACATMCRRQIQPAKDISVFHPRQQALQRVPVLFPQQNGPLLIISSRDESQATAVRMVDQYIPPKKVLCRDRGKQRGQAIGNQSDHPGKRFRFGKNLQSELRMSADGIVITGQQCPDFGSMVCRYSDSIQHFAVDPLR